MDQFMLDVTDIHSETPLKTGDTVTIIGKDADMIQTAADLAEAMGTIHYEILCMLGNRLPKVYIEDRKGE